MAASRLNAFGSRQRQPCSCSRVCWFGISARHWQGRSATGKRQPSISRNEHPEAKDWGAGIGTPDFSHSTSPNPGKRSRSCSSVKYWPEKNIAKNRSGSTQTPGLPLQQRPPHSRQRGKSRESFLSNIIGEILGQKSAAISTPIKLGTQF